MTETRPKQIGRYTVQEELGRGGFGRVYRAYDPTVSRPVAIKVLTEVSKDTETRFRNEAIVAGNLRHKNIVTVHEYGAYQGVPFLVMEYLEGDDLHHLIASRKPLALLEKCDIMTQVADGLAYAYSSGVVHRDMKPANIMVLRDGVSKIMDFGIARLTRTSNTTRLTQQGCTIGTLHYMAPEQLAGAEFDLQCDIFSYGVIFYEFLTGRRPFDAPDPQRLMYKLSFEEPVPIDDYVPNLPDGLRNAISRMIHKDRERRYRTMSDLQLDTEPIRLDLRKSRASELLQQAESLFEQEQLEPARTVVQEALALEPSHRAARALWEALQQQMRQRKLRPRIEAALSAGDNHLAKRQFADAVGVLEAALRLDGENVYVQGRLEQARALVEHSRRASHLLAEARRHFEQQNLTAAFRIVTEALTHDPKNPDAAEFLKTVQDYIERRQVEQRIDEAVRKAEGLLLIPAYDEAFAVLKSADQSSPKVSECLQRVRSQRAVYERQERLHKRMAAATDLLRQQQFEEAAEHLEALRAEFPENQEVPHLLAYALKEQEALARAKAIESATIEALSRAASNDFNGALTALGDALHTHPGDTTLVRLLESITAAKSEWERRSAIKSTLAQCETLRSERRFTEAVQLAERFLEERGAEPALQDLLKKLEAEWGEQQRREAVQEVITNAERWLSEAQFEAAVETLEKGLIRFPDEAALTKLQKRARHALRSSEKARAAKRAAAIERRVQEARTRAAAGDFEGALALLDDGLRSWPDAAALDEVRRTTVAAREADQSRRRALRDLDEIQQLALNESPAVADLLGLATSIAVSYPRDEEIESAAAPPIRLLTDIGSIQHRLAEGDFAQALELCNTLLAQYPKHAALIGFRLDAERRQKRAFLSELHQQAAGELDLQKRARILERGLERYPDETTLADLLQFTHNKLALVEGITGQARTHELAGEWDIALDKWTSVLAIYAGLPGLNAEIERVRARAAQEQQATAGVLRWVEAPALTNPLHPARKAAKGRLPKLIVTGAAAVALAGGVVAFRGRRANPMPVAVPRLSPVVADSEPAAGRTPKAAPPPPSADAPPPSPVAAPPVPSSEPTNTAKEKVSAPPPARMARLEIAGAVPGTQVRVDGVGVGETDIHGALQSDVQPGTHTIELIRDDYTPAAIKQQFRAGKTAVLSGDRLAIARLATTTPPPAPDPKQVDAQEWAQIANSANADDFEAFVRNHPGSAHLDQARARAADLRQQIRNRAAQQAEESAWEKVDQNSRDQLQDYLSHFPSGAHSQQSRARIADIDRQSAEALANQRLNEQKAHEQARYAADIQAIRKLLADFDAAYNHKDLAALEKLWPGIPAVKYRQQFRDATTLKSQLQLLGQPEVNGNIAIVVCSRTFSYRGQSGGSQTRNERVNLNLARDGAGWVIRSINFI